MTATPDRPPLPAPGPALAARNRRVLAGRLGWPDGALDACEHLEQTYPGWRTWYAKPMARGFGGPGYFAVHTRDHQRRNVLYGARPEDLRNAIAAAD